MNKNINQKKIVFLINLINKKQYKGENQLFSLSIQLLILKFNNSLRKYQ